MAIDPSEIQIGKKFWLLPGLGEAVQEEIILQYPVPPAQVPAHIRDKWRAVNANVKQPFVAARQGGHTGGREYHPVAAYCVTRTSTKPEV